MKKPISVFFTIIFFICSISNITCQAAEASQVVRVGYYLLNNYQDLDEDGNYSGYYYDYLQEISQYTGWEYEYVVMDYADCLKALQNQEIDLVCGIDQAEKREETMDFSQAPAITTQYELYALLDNQELCYDDFKNFNHLRVAILNSCNQVDDLDTFGEVKGFSIEKVYFSTLTEMEEALGEGTVDAIYATSVSSLSDMKIIARLPDFPLYFATWKGNTLMDELDMAQSAIANVSPDFEYNLFHTYMKEQQNYRPDFTKEELSYIESAPEIIVTYDPYWAPIEFYDEKTGSYQGITADIFKLLESYTGLHFQYVKSDSFSNAQEAMAAGEVDIISSMSHDYNWAEKNGVHLSTTFLDSSVVIIRNTAKSNERDIAALPKNYYTTSIVSANSEFDEIFYYDSIEECLQAVASGKADVTYANNHVANYYLSSIQFRGLSAAQITTMNENLSIAVSKEEDLRLLSIINKGLSCISTERMDSIVLQNTIYEDQFNMKAFIYAYPELVIDAVVIIFMLIVGLMVAVMLVRGKKTNEIKKISETDSLTNLYNRGASQALILKALEMEGKNSEIVRPLISVDLDNFKQINDTYGHMEGDNLLRAVADTLRNSVRSSDIVGRMGGDEFIVYLCNVANKETAEAVCDKLCKSVNQLSEKKKEWSGISASIGLAFAEKNEIDWEKLYRMADTALYQSKENGKNQYSVSEK